MAGSERRTWLDWQRGVAVLLMIEVHLVNGWTAAGASSGGLRGLLEWAGGLAAPGFLYMAGLAQVLADAALERRGQTPAERRRRHLRRGLWLLAVAYGFRVAEYALGGAFLVPGGYLGILRVDILNVIAVSLILTALVTADARPQRQLAGAVGLGALIVLAAPAVAQLPAAWQLAGYVYSTPGVGFSVFNWAAFALAGGATGVLVRRGAGPGRLLALGAGLAAAGLAGWWLPSVHAPGELWGTSPAWFLVRLGATVGLSGLLSRLPALTPGLGWLTALGRHSLAVYMVSVELTYGLIFKRWHGRLALEAVLVAIVLMTAAMVLLARALDGVASRRARNAPAARAAA